jgi:thiol-disulfide isomerase/thioredoxin
VDLRTSKTAGTRALDVFAIVVLMLAGYELLGAPRLRQSPTVRAPVFSLPTPGGGTEWLSARPGRVVFLDFWASWCEPCRASLPLVERFARAHPDIDVIALDVGEAAGVAGAFAREHDIARVALDRDGRVAGAFGASALPTIVAVDRDGYIRGQWTGFNPAIGLALERARETL